MDVGRYPQILALNNQIKTLIKNHQEVLKVYKQDGKNTVLKNQLDDMTLKIIKLSEHQIVSELLGKPTCSTETQGDTHGVGDRDSDAEIEEPTQPEPSAPTPVIQTAPKVLVKQVTGDVILKVEVQNPSQLVAAPRIEGQPAVKVEAPQPGLPVAIAAQKVGVEAAAVSVPSVVAVPKVEVESPVVVSSAQPAILNASPMLVNAVASQPQLVTLQPHSNVSIMVPLQMAHMQARPAVMTLSDFLSQSNSLPLQSHLNLQLTASIPATPTPTPTILTPPIPVSTPKQSPCGASPSPAATSVAKAASSVAKATTSLPSNLPRRASPPIKVPQYPLNHQSNSQTKGEKNNGAFHRSHSDSDATERRRKSDAGAKEASKALTAAEREKMEFMAALCLYTRAAINEMESRRGERKRRSTANPLYSYAMDTDKRRHMYSKDWLMDGMPAAKRLKGRSSKSMSSPASSRPVTPTENQGNGAQDKGECAECGKGGSVVWCGTCPSAYHLDCLSPPLLAAPTPPWSCPACIVSGKDVGTLSNGALTMVNSYIASKANKEDERRKLDRRRTDLLHEKGNLRDSAAALRKEIEAKRSRCEKLGEVVKEKEARRETLCAFVRSFQDSPAPLGST